MTPEQYKQGLKHLEDQFDKDKLELAREYALANNPYKVGDKVTDHIGSIIIEGISISRGSRYGDLPSCVYSGTALTKKGVPTKRNDKRTVWQQNIEEQ